MRRMLIAVLLLGAASYTGSAPASAAAIFVPGSSFQVQGGGSPDNFTDTVTLTPGNYSLDNGALNLALSIVPDGNAEWLVFRYTTTNGGPLSGGGDWTLNQIGLDAAVPVNFINSYAEFLINGVAQTPSYNFFGGPVISNPVPGETGTGLGSYAFSAPFVAGPLPSLGAYTDPWSSYLNGAGINSTAVNGWEQALEFAPQMAVGAPEASTWTMLILGFAAAGLAGLRSRRSILKAA